MAKILVLGKYYEPFRGGIEENTRDVSRYLSSDNVVEVVTFNHRPGTTTATTGGLTVVRCHCQTVVKSQPLSTGYFGRALGAKADVIHLHAPNFLAAAALMARRLLLRDRTPIVVTHHMDVHGRKLLRAVGLPIARWVAAHSDLVLVTSMKNAAISSDLPAGCRVKAVPLGIDLADYAITDEQRERARALRTALAGPAPVVGFVGRIARYKGIGVLIDALAAMPGVHAIVGGDGPYRPAAEQQAESLGLSGRVHFLGRLTHEAKIRLLLASDVFAFPSTEVTEAFGLSQLEAMAVGTPVVASDLPTGVTDVAVHDRTALLVPPSDAGALAAALARVIADRDLAERLSADALRHVRANLSLDRTVREAAEAILSAARIPRASSGAVAREAATGP